MCYIAVFKAESNMRLLVIASLLALCCSAALARQAAQSGQPAAVAPDKDRIPLVTDTGVAWDMIEHRGQMRWDCRAVPSGKFVMNSLCANAAKNDLHWPGTAPPPGWDGMVHTD
jgi:hypothetical protein